MNFRTTIKIPTYPFELSQQDQLFSIGSCFAENIGTRLATRRFRIAHNPFGILYNPVSIQTCLAMLITEYQFSEKDIFQHHELWHSYYHHGQFSQLDSQLMLENIQQQMVVARKTILTTNRLFITLGTAQVFYHHELNKIVANCHKLPQQQFTKRRLSVKETINSLQPILEELKTQNFDLQCIMTVSPVRHIRDGLMENQKSKATLLLAIDEICGQLDYVHYFPAYEILMDDLRDYRFYKNDLLHPTVAAQDYVWEHFKMAFFNEETNQLNREIEKILTAVEHRPLHPQTEAHRQFHATQLTKIRALKMKYPHLNVSDWERHFA